MTKNILKGLLISGPLLYSNVLNLGLDGPIPVFTRPSKYLILKHAQGAALRHGLNTDLYLAILKAESSLRPEAFNKKSHDIGLAQINRHTAKAHGLNINRLKHDYIYNLNSGALILADFKRRHSGQDGPLWPCRYNVGSGRLEGPKLERCLKYLARVKAQY